MQSRQILVLSDKIENDDDFGRYKPFGDKSMMELLLLAKKKASPDLNSPRPTLPVLNDVGFYPYYFGETTDHFGDVALEIIRTQTLISIIDCNVFDTSRYGKRSVDASFMLGLFGDQLNRNKLKYVVRNEAFSEYWNLLPPSKLAAEQNSDIIAAMAPAFLPENESLILNLVR